MMHSYLQSVPYLTQIIISIVIIISGYLINRFIIQKSIDKFGEKTSLDLQHTKPLKKVASIIMYFALFFMILGTFGLTDVLWGMFAAAGFAGIVVGMATRDVIGDMFTGFLLYIYRPFVIGDSVAIGDIWGLVKDIGVGGVKIKAWSGEIVVIPNSIIRTSIIRNFTITSRRAEITFYVDFTSDFKKTLKLCKKILDEMPEVMKDPAPVIHVDDFTEKSVKILMLVWFSIDEFWEGYAKVQKALAEAFQKRGLKTPIIRREERTNK